MTQVLYRTRAKLEDCEETRVGARSKKPSEESRSRVRRTRSMEIESISILKALPDGDFG
jgi:hypothetical protein